MIEVTIWTDTPEFDNIFTGEGDGRRTFQCEYDYEPPDPTVGILSESIELYRVVDPETENEYLENDLPGFVWNKLQEELIKSVQYEREQTRVNYAIEQQEWNQTFPL